MEPVSTVGRGVALVTGAAGNIGRAIALELVGRDVTVVLADHPNAAPSLVECERACRDVAHAGPTMSTLFDVTDESGVRSALDDVADQVGAVSMLVNNAGYQGSFANVLEYDLVDARRVMEVNVIGPLIVLQEAARQMRNAGRGGSIVNVASMAAHGAVNMAAYSASKSALIGLTRSAAKDLAPFDIRVNSVSPGFIGPGAMWDRQVAAQAEVPSPYYGDDAETVADEMIGQVPLRRYGSLDEVARVVAFLLSGQSSYMTGSDLEIAGGAS